MNRRGFLGAILASCVAPAIVRAESLMRVSGIVVPTTAEVLAVNGNTLVTANVIARECLAILRNNLAFTADLNRDWDGFLKAEPSGTITIRRPARYAQNIRAAILAQSV